MARLGFPHVIGGIADDHVLTERPFAVESFKNSDVTFSASAVIFVESSIRYLLCSSRLLGVLFVGAVELDGAGGEHDEREDRFRGVESLTRIARS